jgi:hypothetical protein
MVSTDADLLIAAASSVVAGVTLAHDDLLLSPLLRDFARYLAHHAWGDLDEAGVRAGCNLAGKL